MQHSKIVLTLAAAIALAACQPDFQTASQQKPAIETYDLPDTKVIQNQQALLTQLRADGVVVVEKGDQLRLIVPTDTFFMSGSSEVKEEKLPDLAAIAAVIKNSQLKRVDVYGYSDKISSAQYAKNMSLEYARVIGAYLWNSGVPTENIKGFGNKHHVSGNYTPQGSADNRRVEILVS